MPLCSTACRAPWKCPAVASLCHLWLLASMLWRWPFGDNSVFALKICATRDTVPLKRGIARVFAISSGEASAASGRHGLPPAAPLVDDVATAASPPPAHEASEAATSADSNKTASTPGGLGGSWVNQRGSATSPPPGAVHSRRNAMHYLGVEMEMGLGRSIEIWAII